MKTEDLKMVEGTALAPFLLIVCACGVVRDSSTPLRFGRNDTLGYAFGLGCFALNP